MNFKAKQPQEVLSQIKNLKIHKSAHPPKKPEISVIVMSTNADKMTANAVKSVLNETSEVIIVNTGSGSLLPLPEEIKDKVTLIETADLQMPGGTRNIGILYSTSPIVSFLAADCMAAPGSLDKRIEAHKKGYTLVSSCLRPTSNSLVSWASYIFIHHARMPERRTSKGGIFGVSYSRSIFEKFGLFNSSMRIAEDTEFNERCKEERTLWSRDIITLHDYPDNLIDALKDIYQRSRRDAGLKSRNGFRQAVSQLSRTFKIWFMSVFDPHIHWRARVSSPLIPVLGIAAILGSFSPSKQSKK